MRKQKFLRRLGPLADFIDPCDPLHVHIHPSEYRTGNVRSTCATTVVDEVVRRNPRHVHISACRDTLALKVIEFELQLQKRLDAKMTGGLLSAAQACANALRRSSGVRRLRLALEGLACAVVLAFLVLLASPWLSG